MNKTHAAYTLAPFPKSRRLYSDVGREGQRKHIFHAFVEVDVTKAREFLREYKARTGESLSFTAFITTCLGRAVDENKSLQAYRKGSKQLVLFEEVDVTTFIERKVAGHWQPINAIIRAANHKTLREIHQEIRAAQAGKAEQTQEWNFLQWYMRLPTFLRSFLWWVVRKHPHLFKRVGGTVALTAVGMFGKGAGWGIPIANHTLTITLGGIGEKPGVVDGQIAIREYLSLTISFDHDIIDGAPAARFTQRLKELIESGYGLPDSTIESELVGAKGAVR